MKQRSFANMMRTIFNTADDDMSCDECYDQIDQYVDLLRTGQDPGEVLPKVKRHLEQCRCCEAEFRALITILEGQSAPEAET